MSDDVSKHETALIVRPQVLPSTAQFGIMRDLAIRLASAKGFLPAHYFLDDRGAPASGEEKMAKVLAAIEYGRAVGIEPMIALQNITMIKGKAGASAMLIGAQLRRAGYKITTSWYDKTGAAVAKETPDVWGCKVVVGKNGEPTGDGVFSMTDAQRAGLIKDDSGWQRYPKDMLYARALTQAAREGAQDAVLGMAYTAEELGGEADYDGNVETVRIAPGVSEAVGSLPAAAIQPTPPAPSVEVAANAAPAVEDERSDRGQAGAQPPPPTEGVPAAEVTQGSQAPAAEVTQAPPPPTAFAPAPLSGASVSRRMGRSIGPQPKRTNTVEVPHPATGPVEAARMPASAPEAVASAIPQPEAVPSQPAPSPLTDEPIPAAPVDEGERVYAESLRQDLRLRAAVLAHLNAVVKNNLVHPLKNEPLEVVPPATPSDLSDNGLQLLIDRDFPGRTLDTLGPAELQNRLELIEPFITKRREQLAEKGIPEE